MLCVRRSNHAGPAGRVSWQVQCREPKTGQQKVQLYYDDYPLCPSRNIIYLIVPFKEVSLRILKGLEAAVEVVKDVLKQYDSDSSK